jgi:hypothetical protein
MTLLGKYTVFKSGNSRKIRFNPSFEWARIEQADGGFYVVDGGTVRCKTGLGMAHFGYDIGDTVEVYQTDFGYFVKKA